MNRTIYEMVGICDGKPPRIYKSGTIKEIEEDEMLDQIKHNTIDDILRDMDCFSNYKHYARATKVSKLN